VEPICILEWNFKVLKKKSIGLVKAQWTCYSPKDATWENKKSMWEAYLQIFENFEEN
jgi:hypothetical protein